MDNSIYFKAIEGSDSGLWVCDLETQFCYLSNRYYTMLGYEPNEFEGTLPNLFSLLHPDDVERSQQVLEPVFEGKTETYRNEVRLRKKSGGYIHILTQGQVERDDEKNVTKLIGWNIDISPLKDAQKKLDEERALNAMNSRLAQLGLLSGGIAHEINNPLTVIRMRTEMMLKTLMTQGTLDTEHLFQSLSLIQSASKKITNIVYGLRTISDGGVDNQKKEFFLKDVVDELLSLCTHEIEKKGIKLHLTTNIEKETVVGNFALLCQVILNLLLNAYDALENQTEKDIWIEVTSDSNYALLSVEDNGTGIKEEDRDKIMLPFFTTKPPGKGTGLGLSISKSILNSFSGDLSFESEKGRTKFTVKIPLAVHLSP